jgi:hypothetical protein
MIRGPCSRSSRSETHPIVAIAKANANRSYGVEAQSKTIAKNRALRAVATASDCEMRTRNLLNAADEFRASVASDSVFNSQQRQQAHFA